MTESCVCPKQSLPWWHGDNRTATDIGCPLHGWERAPLWFFPYGIAKAPTQNGTGEDVTLTCGCVLFYVSGKRHATALCWEHQSQYSWARAIVLDGRCPALCN